MHDNSSSLVEHLSIDFKAVFDSIPGSFVILQPNIPDFTILAISDEMVRTSGREKHNLIGKGLFEVFPENPDAATAPGPSSLRTSLQNALQYKRVDPMPVVRYDVIDAQGVFHERYWAASNKPVLNKEGKVLYLIHSTLEVTEQVHAQQKIEAGEEQLFRVNQALLQTNQQLTRANIDLDNFIYAASHDLKAPILNIEGLIEALQDQLSPDHLQAEDVAYTLHLLSDSVQRFKRTIGNLTDITKLQKENSLVATPVDLAEIIAEVQLDLAPVIQEAKAQVEVDVTSCRTVYFSEKNLRSIIYNLVSNALKYRSPLRDALVQIHCQETEEYQVLSVKDNGLGMDLTGNVQLFTMFKRFHNHVEGTGIGLYMVKKIIENAGGKITVQSKIDEGTTFQVYFRRFN